MDKNIIIKKDAVALVRKRLKEMLKPIGFQPHPKSKGRLIHIREDDLIEEVTLRTDGYHLEPCFFMYYRKAPFASLYVDLVNGSLWRVMEEREKRSIYLRWNVEFPKKPEQKNYYYPTEHFEEVWQDVKLALERYILPYMKSMTVEKLLSFMIKGSRQDDDYFEAHNIVRFSDKYFTCLSEAAVYGVGMWIAEKYVEGLSYIIFAQNKYREWTRNHDQKCEDPMYHCYQRILEMLDTIVDIYERKPQELRATVQTLTDQIATNWVEYE